MQILRHRDKLLQKANTMLAGPIFKRLLTAVAGGSILVSSSATLAVTLGEIELESSLNQPLQATIELSDLDGVNTNDLVISIGSVEDYGLVDLSRPELVDSIQFEVVADTIELSSDTVVNNTFLNLVLNVSWPAGRLIREYTVLVDLPVFSDNTGANTQANPPQSNASTITVNEGDTLWAIANEVRAGSGLSVQQTMMALLRNNSEAFIGNNINRVRSGAVLRIPSRAEIASLSQNQAFNQVAQQNTSALSFQPIAAPSANPGASAANQGDELSVLTDEQGDENRSSIERLENQLALSEEDLDRAKIENEELNSRLEDLESEIEILQNIIAIEDQRIAQLQEELAAQAEEATAAIAAAQAAVDTAQDAATMEDTVVQDVQDDSVMGTIKALTQKPIAIGAAIAILIVMVLGFLFWRNQKSKETEGDDELAKDMMSDVEEDDVSPDENEALAIAPDNEDDDEAVLDAEEITLGEPDHDVDGENDEDSIEEENFSLDDDIDDVFEQEIDEDLEIDIDEDIEIDVTELDEDGSAEDDELSVLSDGTTQEIAEDEKEDLVIETAESEEQVEESVQVAETEIDELDELDDLDFSVELDSDDPLTENLASEVEVADDNGLQDSNIESEDDNSDLSAEKADDIDLDLDGALADTEVVSEESEQQEDEKIDFSIEAFEKSEAEDVAQQDDPASAESADEQNDNVIEFQAPEQANSSSEEATEQEQSSNDEAGDIESLEFSVSNDETDKTESNDAIEESDDSELDVLDFEIEGLESSSDTDAETEEDDFLDFGSIGEDGNDFSDDTIEIDDNGSEDDSLMDGLSEEKDEVATKLDLAVAYQAMGDLSGAQVIIDEVLVQGNEEQIQEAQNLRDKWKDA